MADNNDLLQRYQRALEGLTPGGSEFYHNPELCAEHIRARLSRNWQAVVKFKIERDTLELRVKALEKQLKVREEVR